MTRLLTSQQRRRIRQVIRDGHLAFLAEMFGPTAIDHEDFERLRAAGTIRSERLLPQDAAYAAHALGSIAGDAQASVLGRMRAEMEREAIADVHNLDPDIAAREFGLDEPTPYEQLQPELFWRRLRDDPQVVTEAEREAIAMLRERIGQQVRGLGNRLDEATGRAITDAEDAMRRRRLTQLQRETVRGAQERDAAREVADRVRAATRDLRRDWLRCVHAEMHTAIEEAKAIVIAHRSDDRDPRVFKRPRPDACSFCVLLFLRPDGVTPRVFRLSQLLANGTNVGRRAGRPSRSGKSRTEWKAVIGAVHPFCQCELHVLPPGMGFNKQGEMVYVGMKKSTDIEVEALDEALAKHTCEE